MFFSYRAPLAFVYTELLDELAICHRFYFVPDGTFGNEIFYFDILFLTEQKKISLQSYFSIAS